MFSSIGLRIAARIISPTLAPTRPTLSRALFVSHFQTRSFLSTSRLARDTVQTTSVKTHSNSAKKKPAAKKRVTAKKKTPVKKIVPLKPKKGTSYPFVRSYSHVETVRPSDYPPYNRANSQACPQRIYSILPGIPCKQTKSLRYESRHRTM